MGERRRLREGFTDRTRRRPCEAESAARGVVSREETRAVIVALVAVVLVSVSAQVRCAEQRDEQHRRGQRDAERPVPPDPARREAQTPDELSYHSVILPCRTLSCKREPPNLRAVRPVWSAMPSRVTLTAVLVVVWGLALAAWGAWFVEADSGFSPGDPSPASPGTPLSAAGPARTASGRGACSGAPDRPRAARVSAAIESPRQPLTVRLFDESGGPAPRMNVRLWRLERRSSDDEGADRIEERTTTDADGELRFTALSPGRYRLQVIGLREGAEDPPPFDVPGDEVLEFRVAVARTWDMALEVRMQDGTMPPIVEVRGGGAGRSSGLGPGTPAWADPAPEDRELYGSGYACGSGVPREWTATVLQGGRLPLGTWTERTREGGSRSHTKLVRAAGSATLACRASTSGAGPGSFVGWLPRADEFARLVRLPDGSCAADAGAEIEVECLAVRRLPDDPEDHWRSAPIRITAKLDGWESLDTTFRPLLGEAPSLIMRRK